MTLNTRKCAEPSDSGDILRKFDRESRTRVWEGRPAIAVRALLALFSLYCILSTLFSVAALEARLAAFLGFITIAGYLTYPASKHCVRPNSLPWYDIALMAVGAGCFFFYSFGYDSIVRIITSASRMTPVYTAIGIIGILCLAELCRRCVGLPILCVAAALLIYTFAVARVDLQRAVFTLFYSTSGILSTPTNVCAKYIVVFIIFGAFLERTGISAFFISLANALTGWACGGPAKVAVISSALCGMVSGSSVGNTVTTGSVTIPMMKRTGYSPEFAGAVEAAASTGGQIMPPIMGAAAFLMAEYISGASYGTIALHAILPAVLYFAGIFISVHLEAKKTGLAGIPRSELPRLAPLLKKLYLLLPLALLIGLVASGARTLQFSASVSILAAIAVGALNSDCRITPSKIIEALESGGRSVITVAAACAMAGVISGCITATGLASKLISGILTLSGGSRLIALFLTMLCCIVLGMGVPTTANYCIMASTCAPILIRLGLGQMEAHFFVFYFGIVADITPPVALAAYAGSAIAGGNPIKTGFTATRLAIAAFIVPYVFAFDPSLLLLGADPMQAVRIACTSVVGIFGIAAGLGGFMRAKLNLPLRALSVIGGLLLIYPTPITDIAGVVIVGSVLLVQTVKRRRTPIPDAV